MTELIAAAATGGGLSAIAVVRVSGPGTLEAVDRVFRPLRGLPMSAREDRKLVYGALLDSAGRTLDLCLCTVSRGPRSYTGEDTAELQCHGSPVVVSEALRALFAAGARQALPGEFTKRAFLNGRMDLTGAEAVADLIESETPEAARNAAGQLGGAVFRLADGVRELLTGLIAHFQAAVDWPEEDIPPFRLEEYARSLGKAEETLSALLATCDRGRVLKSGALCVLLGTPNVGKSSLLNALLGYERAIVTPEAGTTRDTVEEKLRVGGVLLRLTDTAGVRPGESDAERAGVTRALTAARQAEAVLAVFDGSRALDGEDLRVLEAASRVKRAVAVVNKSDLPLAASLTPIREALGEPVLCSAQTGAGLDNLCARLSGLLPPAEQAPAGQILTNTRQEECVRRALEDLRQAREAARAGMTPDAVLVGLEDAQRALAALTGRDAGADVAEQVFHRFCVGK